ncbi:hypothetical protein J6590_082993 [Homalodisca vitripennis]|nr:hypothetical protein J6590_082993 [Homalodisca vitripennis]
MATNARETSPNWHRVTRKSRVSCAQRYSKTARQIRCQRQMTRAMTKGQLMISAIPFDRLQKPLFFMSCD